MGSSNEKNRLLYEHQEEMEAIRNEKDIAKQKLLIKEKALQYDLEKHRAEMERLAQLDKYHYNIEMEKVKQI